MRDIPTLPQPGEILAGKYEVVRLVGKGGMGAVFEARHLRLKQRFALKMLKPELLAHADCVTRFDREARAAARMTCPNVARIFDVDHTPSGIPYMVIEFLEGHDLSHELGAHGKLPVAEAVDIVIQACSAMVEAHALGVVHRDLKPANLFICGRPPARMVKVLDFGISKVFADEDVSQATTPSLTLGTPHYMSPEQILASKDVDSRSDIWSLGVILYKAIAGRFPFEGDSATALVVAVATTKPVPLEERAEVDPRLAAAVMKALAKERDARWSKVEELACAIEPFGTGRVKLAPVVGISGPPPAPLAADQAPTIQEHDVLPTAGNWTKSPRDTRRGRWRVGASIVGACAVVGAIAFAATRAYPPRHGAAMAASAAHGADGVPAPAAAPPDPPSALSSSAPSALSSSAPSAATPEAPAAQAPPPGQALPAPGQALPPPAQALSPPPAPQAGSAPAPVATDRRSPRRRPPAPPGSASPQPGAPTTKDPLHL